MKTKTKIFVYLLMVLMLALQILPTSAQGKTPPPVAITESDEPSNEDASWPIIKTETHKRKDPSTGQEIIEKIVIRQEPPTNDKLACKDKLKLHTAAATCTINSYSVTVQAQVSVGAGSYVTGYVKNIADEYCSNIAGCGFYKMKKLQAWWTRTSTNFSVRNAKATWGCSVVCALCTGGTTSYVWQSAYFNPTWDATGLKSVVKTWTSTTMPIMSSMGDFGGYPIGGTDSLVILPRTQHTLSVYATFYP